MSPSEQRIADYLAANTGRVVGGYELRDEAGCATEGSVRVLVNRLRKRGVAIASRNGPRGGYQLARNFVPPKSLPRGMTREFIAATIERLVDLLDAFDGDPDLEAEIDHGADDVGECPGDTFLCPPARYSQLKVLSA